MPNALRFARDWAEDQPGGRDHPEERLLQVPVLAEYHHPERGPVGISESARKPPGDGREFPGGLRCLTEPGLPGYQSRLS